MNDYEKFLQQKLDNYQYFLRWNENDTAAHPSERETRIKWLTKLVEFAQEAQAEYQKTLAKQVQP